MYFINYLFCFIRNNKLAIVHNSNNQKNLKPFYTVLYEISTINTTLKLCITV